jgi:hypothetical protein
MLIALLVVGFASTVSSGAISLVADTNIPEPNEEITVYVQTDAPLFAMGLGIEVIGDANITTAMCEADCNQYGWDNGWNSDPYFEDNWVYLSGVSWPSEANGVVGYIKFRYNSGQVTVSIFESEAFDANCQFVEFSDVPLVFGQPDPNDYNPENDSSSQDTIIDENIPATAESPNDVNLPIVSYWQDKQAQRQKHLMRCPADSNSSRETFDKSEWAERFQVERDDSSQTLLDGEPNIIEINSDITTNQIWTANNIYWVTVPINVQALLVIEPNTVVMFGDDYGYYDCALFVNNGGTLISKGTPDKPIIYTCDFLYPDWGYYWEYLPDYGQYYFCPIYIEKTASPATTVTYSFIEGAVIGIATDNITLDHPIENNYLFGNLYGIGEYGTKHTDIRNNLCYYNYYSGIDVHLADVNGVGDANSVITIVNNTCDTFQDNGITVHGVGNEGDAGLVMLINNIVSQSYVYGLNLVDGYMIGIVSNTGYYDNPANKNWEFEEDNPVIVTQNPFTTGSGYFDLLYLNQNCPFINAGLEYVEETPLIGTTTDINNTPDSNKIDIGFHYPNWDYSNAGEGDYYAGDLDRNLIVDFRDFAILANGWRQTYDMNNLVEMCSNWLMIGGPAPNIQPVFNQDPNNFKGFVQISADIFDLNAYRLFILMDGEKYSEIFDFDEPISGIQTDSFANGRHSFKIVRIENDGNVICSQPYDVNFNNEVSCIKVDSGYTSDKGYSFYAFGTAGESYNAEIKDLINDSVIYTSDFNDNISIKAMPSVFTEPYHIYSVVVTDDTTEIVNRVMGRKFNPNPTVVDANVKMVVSIGSEDINNRDIGSIIPAVIKAADNQNLNPQYLPYEDCTWENLSRLLKDYPNVTYWYHDSHGGFYVPVPLPSDPCNIEQRTWIETKGCNRIFSKLAKDSWPNVPPDYRWLGIWEFCDSIAELGFESNPKLEYIRMNTCFSARYPDFAVAAGIINGEPYYDPLGDRIYVGWKDVSYTCDWYWKWYGLIPIPIPVYYRTFEVAYFYHQGIGDSVGHAATNAIMDQPLIIRNILWDELYPNIKYWGAHEVFFYFGQ